MANFDAQVVELIGGTLDQVACDQWAVEGAREIIMQLPVSMQEKCSEKTTVTSGTALDLDTASYGKILYCTRHNGSYEIPCRLVSSQYAGLTTDSTASNYYAVADDPAYFIRDNEVVIKPDPGSDGGSFYYVVYPTSIDISAVSTIANFPIECEHLLIKYIAMHQLLANQSAMSSSWDADITTAITAVNTALDRINDHVWDDEETFLTTNSQLTRVKGALDNAESVINGNQPSTTTDAYGALAGEDLELMSGALSVASAISVRASSTSAFASAISVAILPSAVTALSACVFIRSHIACVSSSSVFVAVNAVVILLLKLEDILD